MKNRDETEPQPFPFAKDVHLEDVLVAITK
jgi:hypothetical protein